MHGNQRNIQFKSLNSAPKLDAHGAGIPPTRGRTARSVGLRRTFTARAIANVQYVTRGLSFMAIRRVLVGPEN